MVIVLARTSSSESNGTTATTGPIKWKRVLISPYNFFILLRPSSGAVLHMSRIECK